MAYLYPYGDTQQLNLDWLIEQWNEVKSQIDGSLQAEIDRVEAAITDLLTARDEAVAAQTAAQASAQAAAGSASTASGAASTATAQALAASASAATAGAHASDAQGYAATAQQSAQAANNDAAAAAVSEGNARNSETAAAGSSSAAAGNALYAEGYAKGTQNGNPVSSGSPYYENNAKYYSDQAAQDAANAAAAGAVGKSISNVPIASFDDGTEKPVLKLIVDIDPVQSGSGNPAPDNVRPITGWTGANVVRTGKNLFGGLPFALAVGEGNLPGQYSIDTDAKTFIFTRSVASESGDYKRLLFNKITNNRCTAIITYKNNANNSSLCFEYLDGTTDKIELPNTNGIKTTTAVVSNSSKTISRIILYYFDDAPTTVYYEESGFFNGVLTADEFAAYSAQTIPITFPDAAGTVYGGTLNVVSGEMVVDRAEVDMGDVDWLYNSTYSLFRLLGQGNANNTSDSPSRNYCTCYKYEYGGGAPYNTFTLGANGYFVNEILVKTADYTDPSVFKTAMQGQKIVYELATPIEYTLTSQEVITLLEGVNNVWADTGNINLLEYYANSKKYIDDQDALIKALIAKELPDMTADTALVANDFRIVNNTLYRVTAPVASGGTLTPGTNCTATTITEVLKSLL